ncbi:hypothetical protein [uncultured Chitinophaga sp.]|uniref:hypothetical protein n=1 Tax=uncultured Chitinophaga sp. TaxID=339340 RepID=UPI0026231E99|nr:hypothetical protein [uncultured Chitinophaga sp.]
MKNIPRSQMTCLELWQKAGEASQRKSIGKTTIEWAGYTREQLEQKEHFVPTDFTIVQPSLLRSLEARELRLAVTIIEELCRNNMLWYFDHREDSRDKKAISSLRARGVLHRTEEATIHIVNPWFIRKGDIPATIAATSSVLNGSKKVTQDMIKPLQGKDTKFSPYQMLQL